MTEPIEVTAAVIVRDQHVLVCQRAAGSSHAGKWEFPGGKREAGESLEECLQRELEEELGITAQIGRVLATTRHHYAGRGWIELTFFEIASFEGTPTNCIFAEIRWVQIANLETLDFLEADREFIHRMSSGDIALSGC